MVVGCKDGESRTEKACIFPPVPTIHDSRGLFDRNVGPQLLRIQIKLVSAQDPQMGPVRKGLLGAGKRSIVSRQRVAGRIGVKARCEEDSKLVPRFRQGRYPALVISDSDGHICIWRKTADFEHATVVEVTCRNGWRQLDLLNFCADGSGTRTVETADRYGFRAIAPYSDLQSSVLISAVTKAGYQHLGAGLTYRSIRK
jgi:hypothetical protein